MSVGVQGAGREAVSTLVSVDPAGSAPPALLVLVHRCGEPLHSHQLSWTHPPYPRPPSSCKLSLWTSPNTCLLGSGISGIAFLPLFPWQSAVLSCCLEAPSLTSLGLGTHGPAGRSTGDGALHMPKAAVCPPVSAHLYWFRVTLANNHMPQNLSFLS